MLNFEKAHEAYLLQHIDTIKMIILTYGRSFTYMDVHESITLYELMTFPDRYIQMNLSTEATYMFYITDEFIQKYIYF